MRRAIILAIFFVAFATTPALASGSGTWTLVSHMHQTRSNQSFAAASTGSRLYAIGGRNFKTGVLTGVEAFNPVMNTWKVVASLPQQRYALCAAALNGKVYALGGTQDFAPVADNLIYTPGTNSWVVGPPIPTPVVSEACSRDAGHDIYVFDTATVGGHVYKLDTLTGIWTTMASTVPTLSFLKSAVLGPDGNIYIVIGIGPMDVYHPTTDSWSKGTPSPVMGQASLGLDGRLYVTGGAAYSFTTQLWSLISPAPDGGEIGMARGGLFAFGGSSPSNSGASGETFRFAP